ncbi:uncharacterized protein TNCV_2821551 [Trichonephila clavipes]|uniref:Uncharacterized protein n=1 Tax=Trichonephila clavipes TaxID=2585209 RepID=A0A8X6WHL1_TRICX|nr:uncharacterized protein TNCV_2821551 [Trichonephila clavipes]
MLPVLGKKAVLEWCMKEGLIGSSYVCPKCGKSMELRERMATRGLLATDHVILNHGQVTWTTPELAPLSPKYHTTPREDVSALDRIKVHRCPTRRVFCGTGLELVTRQATIPDIYTYTTRLPQSLSRVKAGNES